MSSSRAIKPRREDNLLTGWESVPDKAPSIVRAEQPTVARVLALVGVFLILLGLIPVVGPRMGVANPLIGSGLGFMSASTGILLLLFHALVDRDLIFRRLYAYLGLLCIALAIVLRAVPMGGSVGGYFAIAGIPALVVGLVLLIATARLETEPGWRTVLVNVLGAVGAVMILSAVGIGLLTRVPFLTGEGAVYLILGLLYVGAFIGLQESQPIAYYTGVALGIVGVIAFAGGATRSYLSEGNLFLVPSGLMLMVAGVLYVGTYAGVCLDWPIVVMTRRELASYFYSPIAYLVLIGWLFVGWYMFWQFLQVIIRSSAMGGMFEPIIGQYVFEIIPVFVQMFVVPILTMRLLAEEQRTGTLEVLLTAPVNEVTVVLSKFLAAWLFYLLTWIPWWLNLVALRYMGGEEFDYRPMLSFDIVLLAISAGFISMGLFFSSVTKNQIIAAVLTFVGMIGHLAAYIIKFRAGLSQGSTWYEVLTYVSYLDLWWNSLEGVFAPRYLLFHISATVFFLYATVKVLEARKWK